METTQYGFGDSETWGRADKHHPLNPACEDDDLPGCSPCFCCGELFADEEMEEIDGEVFCPACVTDGEEF